MQSTIANYCLEVSIDGHSEPQVVPKLSLQMSVQELHNSTVSSPEEGGIKESRDSDNNITVTDSTLRSILQSQLNNISERYRVMCGFEFCISTKSIHS